MRGKGSFAPFKPCVPGITPAYAGKRLGMGLGKTFTGDHPRLCGEKSLINERYVLLPGSPPPMRGKADISAAGNVTGGITPAYAGKR